MMRIKTNTRWLLSGLFLLQTTAGSGTVAAQQQAELTLERALHLYVSSSPEVEAERQLIEMARGEQLQVGLFPNPYLNYSQEGFPLGAQDSSFFQDQEFILWGSQKLELGGKRSHRKELSRLRLEAAEAEFEDWLLQRKAQLKETFYRACFSEQKRNLARQHLETYREVRETHRHRYNAGDVSGLSQLRVDLEEVRFLSAVNQSETDFTSAWTELSAFIGWPDATLPQLELAPDSFPDASLEDLKALAFRSRPDLKALVALSPAGEEKIRLEQSQRIPDLTVEGGYKRDFGINSFYAGFQLPVPLFDRNQGAIYQAQAARRRIENQHLWKRLQVSSAVERAYQTYLSQQSHVDRLKADLLTRAEQTLEITRQSYQEGEASLTDYLDTLRVRLEASLSYYDLLFQLQRARIELEKATGTELP